MALTLTKPHDVRNAWFIWAGFVVAILVLVTVEGHTRTATPAYRDGASAWLAGGTLYTDDWDGFLYTPHAAIAFVPFHLLPYAIGELLWRVVAIGTLAWGVRRACVAASTVVGVELFPLTTLLCLLPIIPAARNGQMTLPVAGLMLWAVELLVRRRWWSAALLLVVATVLKPTSIVLLLLLGAVRPRLLIPIAGCLVIVLASPLLVESPARAWSDLTGWVAKMRSASEPAESLPLSDVVGGARAFGVEVPRQAAYGLRLVAAAVTLVLSVVAIRRHGAARGVMLTATMGFCYLLLFNPRTENNTYSALAPVQAIAASWLILGEGRRAAGIVVAALPVIGLCGYELGGLLTPDRRTWLAPLAASVFAVLVVVRVLGPRRVAPEEESPAADHA